MTPAEFDFLRGFIKERSGIVLADDKQYLVESRLTPVARRHRLASISEIAAEAGAACAGARGRRRRGDDHQ